MADEKRHFYFYIGTTAELIKLAPVIKEFQNRKVKFKIIVSGQTKVHFKEFNDWLGIIKPDIVLKQKKGKPSVFHFLIWMIKAFFSSLVVFSKEFSGKDKKTVYFIVHGDTVSSLIGTVIARVYGLKIVHIEAGLRSFNFFEPFPEEISRCIISLLADIHFCPNEWSFNNLKNAKGIKINTTQNTLIESCQWALKRESSSFRQMKGKYFVLVVHRQEHVIFARKWTKSILKYIFKQANPQLRPVCMIYDFNSDILKSALYDAGLKENKVILMPRLSYPNFVRLIREAEFLITDGGSNQEEAYYMGKPTLLLRNHTERIEGLEKNVLLSRGKKTVIKKFLRNYFNYETVPIRIYRRPSKTIVDSLGEN